MVPSPSPAPAPTAAPTLDLTAYETLDGLPSSPEEEDSRPIQQTHPAEQPHDTSNDELDANEEDKRAEMEENAEEEAEQEQQTELSHLRGRRSSAIAQRSGSLLPLEISCLGLPAPIPVLTPVNSPCMENGGDGTAATKGTCHVHIALQDVNGNALLTKPVEGQSGRQWSGKTGSETYFR
jgi:hypothetical protein